MGEKSISLLTLIVILWATCDDEGPQELSDSGLITLNNVQQWDCTGEKEARD